MADTVNLAKGQRAQRKTLITVAEWETYAVLTAEPSNWATSYNTYYTKSGNVYSLITDSTAPSFTTGTYYEKIENREILGARTEDSSIEFNPDTETSTDILGITYTDVNKTEPQQDFDPFFLLGGSKLGAYLGVAALENDIDAYNGTFAIYVIAAFIGTTGSYKCVRHNGCTILPTSMGGDSYVSMPIEVHYSNNIDKGTVDKLSDDFTFTKDV